MVRMVEWWRKQSLLNDKMTNEKDQIYKEKFMAFAIRIVKLKNYLNTEKHEYNIADQIQRSGTAIGANHREAIAAQSALTINQLAICKRNFLQILK